MTTLRILMISHTPWDLRLGAPSVQMRVGAHLSEMGHRVDYFGYEEAVTRPPRTRVGHLLAAPFATRAVPAVRDIADGYDVIDAHQGNLPMSREQLEFGGRLVTRSAGLTAAYRRFLDSVHEWWPEAPETNRWARPLRARQAQRETRDAFGSYEAADLILVPNPSEADELASQGYGTKTRMVPNGVTDDLVEQGARLAGGDPGRAESVQVAIIATWDLRKGRLDWGHVIDAVRRAVPDARFLFLGTGIPAEQVHSGLGGRTGVDVMPSYDPAELPGLLSDAKVGALASYVEGFGLGLVEQMACGLPVVAYDVPGPRHTVGSLDNGLLVSAGDKDGLARNLVRMLTLEPAEYSPLAARARATAARFRYSVIATQTLTVYQDALVPHEV